MRVQQTPRWFSYQKPEKSNIDVEDKLIQILLQRKDRYQNKGRSGRSEPEYKQRHRLWWMTSKRFILIIRWMLKWRSWESWKNIRIYQTIQDIISPEPPRNMSSQLTMSSQSLYDDGNTEDSMYADLFTKNYFFNVPIDCVTILSYC